MPSHDDDLSLLLSLRDRIAETPPASPSRSPILPVLSPSRRHGDSDMSIFRDAVKDYLAVDDPVEDILVREASKPSKGKRAADIEVEKFSGLRIRKCLLSQVDINRYFSDVRFIRLMALRSSLMGDSISGCWATAGILTEKLSPRQSSNGKTYSVWKFGALDESVVSVFLFNDAYTSNENERLGTVFALFNSTVRKESSGNGFCLSIYSAGQIVKLGISADYGICKGKRKDGSACTMAINKQQGMYCKYHASGAAQRYHTKRTELKGGNLKTGFRLQSEGIYMFDPHKDGLCSRKAGKPLQVLSVDGLKKVLSGANKVTSNKQSQGIRFLSEVTAHLQPNKGNRGSTDMNNVRANAVKRSSTSTIASVLREPESKKQKVCETPNLIELDFAYSDEEM